MRWLYYIDEHMEGANPIAFSVLFICKSGFKKFYTSTAKSLGKLVIKSNRLACYTYIISYLISHGLEAHSKYIWLVVVVMRSACYGICVVQICVTTNRTKYFCWQIHSFYLHQRSLCTFLLWRQSTWYILYIHVLEDTVTLGCATCVSLRLLVWGTEILLWWWTKGHPAG